MMPASRSKAALFVILVSFVLLASAVEDSAPRIAKLGDTTRPTSLVLGRVTSEYECTWMMFDVDVVYLLMYVAVAI